MEDPFQHCARHLLSLSPIHVASLSVRSGACSVSDTLDDPAAVIVRAEALGRERALLIVIAEDAWGIT